MQLKLGLCTLLCEAGACMLMQGHQALQQDVPTQSVSANISHMTNKASQMTDKGSQLCFSLLAACDSKQTAR